MTDLQRVKKAINWLIFIGFAENERDIAEKLGYKKASLSQILNGHSPLSEKFVKNLCSADKNLNEVWILKGVGDMFLNHESSSSPVEMVSIPKDVWDVIKETHLVKFGDFLNLKTIANAIIHIFIVPKIKINSRTCEICLR